MTYCKSAAGALIIAAVAGLTGCDYHRDHDRNHPDEHREAQRDLPHCDRDRDPHCDDRAR